MENILQENFCDENSHSDIVYPYYAQNYNPWKKQIVEEYLNKFHKA